MPQNYRDSLKKCSLASHIQATLVTAILPNRIIGDYSGAERGPMVLVFGGMHGNEPAGVEALETLFHLLHIEPGHNPGFTFRGRLLALRGNRRALARGLRYLHKDINRQWRPDHLRELLHANPHELQGEDIELRELCILIEAEVARYQPERLYVLDLHTTTADGGIFTISSDDPESIALGQQLHAPVITGILRGLSGTTLHYFTDGHFDCRTVALSFEAGQHQDPLSPKRAIAAIINLLRAVGCVRSEDVENKHDEILMAYSQGLPKVADLVYTHRIRQGDNFCMEPGYANFQPVKAGELLAHDANGPIRCPFDALILMPLYQHQGEDGFFLVKPC